MIREIHKFEFKCDFCGRSLPVEVYDCTPLTPPIGWRTILSELKGGSAKDCCPECQKEKVED